MNVNLFKSTNKLVMQVHFGPSIAKTIKDHVAPLDDSTSTSFIDFAWMLENYFPTSASFSNIHPSPKTQHSYNGNHLIPRSSSPNKFPFPIGGHDIDTITGKVE